MFGTDPLLFQSRIPQNYQQDIDLKQQMNNTLEQYKVFQQQQLQRPEIRDYVGEIDNITANLSPQVFEKLRNDKEYMELSMDLQTMIQNELIASIKWSINSNPNAVKNMEKQREIIENTKHACDEEERKNLNELNDYIKNYSSLTFDDYKKLKQGNYETRRTETENR